MHKITLYFLLFYFFLLPSNVLAQEELEVSATPFISNFAPEDYQADPQNWFLTQDQQGIMYVANTLGVLTYDGVAWEKISLPNIIARSVVTGTNGKVYVGSQGDFGYLAANSQGEMRYSSLLDKIPAEYKNFADIWSCFATPTNTYFFSSTHLFCLQNEKIAVIKAPKKFRFCFKTDDLLYTQDDSLGLVRIADQTLQTMPNAAFFLDKEIRSILPYQANSLLITTLKHGLWVYDTQTGNVKTLGDSNTNNFLINNLVFCGRKLQNNLFAIGTFRNGLVILNEEGEIVNLINEGAGLRNNSVRQLWLDAHGGLWLALNNGVSRIEIHLLFLTRNKVCGVV
jgi:ligand-binding sensor domain-containing protein